MQLPEVMKRLVARRRVPLAPNVQVLDLGSNRLTLMDPGSALADTPDARLAIDEKTMSAGFVISTSRRDRVGDVVVPDGCLDTLGDYAANPVVFYGHQTTCPPVASSMSPDGRLSLWFEEDRILARGWFHGKTRESEETFALVAAGILKAASIGFVPDEADLMDVPDVEAQLARGTLEFDFGGFVFKRWHLLEWSVVPVPANPGALRSYLDAGKVKSPVLRRTLTPMAAPRTTSLWLDGPAQMICKGMLEDLVAPPAHPAPEPPEVDLSGRPQDGTERPQAVLLSSRRFPTPDEAKAWLDENALSASAFESPGAEGEDYVAVLFPAGECEADSVRKQKVEDGVTMVFCKPCQAEESEPVPTTEDAKSDLALVTRAMPRDVVRWNKSLSDVFDVASEPLPPATLEYDWVCKHVGCQVKEISQGATEVPSARMGSWLTGLQTLLADCKLVDTRNIWGGSEAPPVFELVQLNSKRKADFLVEGTSFYRGPSGDFALRFSPSWYGLHVTTFIRRENREYTQSLIQGSWDWARENNFLKGEAFSLSGEFLERTAEGWDDVFLEQENKDAMRAVVSQINAKKAAFPNRGVILTGPPGTGKTLSGRIVRNTAEATFIWVAARDFYRSGGGFGGLAYGFEMARELAPAILFIEDVDNWLSDRTIDMLKTEMDGIARSAGVLTVLTTNFPEQLPEALIDRPGRFHDVLCFANPTKAARAEMLAAWLPGVSQAVLSDAAGRTEGYSGAHVRELANFAHALKDSQDIGLDAAVPLAIDKVEKQKEVIAGVQRHGAKYRPHKDIEQYVTRRLKMQGVVNKSLAAPGEASETVAKADPQPGIEVPKATRKPYGAEVLEKVCGHAEAMHCYMADAVGVMEPESKPQKLVRRLMAKVAKMHGASHGLGSESYPDHFGAKPLEGAASDGEDADEFPREKQAALGVELADLLGELAADQTLSPSRRIACESYAGRVRSLAPVTSAPAPTPEPEPAAKAAGSGPAAEHEALLQTKLAASLAELQRVFFEITGREV